MLELVLALLPVLELEPELVPEPEPVLPACPPADPSDS
jgi:hypothetical protein